MWPPLQETISRTVRELDLLARYGAVVNLFMLGRTPDCVASSTPSPAAPAAAS